MLVVMQTFADKLDETILNAIERATFVIVDLTHDPATGLRGSVLFEAGYAYRLKPVIWMCPKTLQKAVRPLTFGNLNKLGGAACRLQAAKRELVNVIEGRIIERGKRRENHEVRRLILETWKKIEVQKDIVLPNSSSDRISADQIRLVLFQELSGEVARLF